MVPSADAESRAVDYAEQLLKPGMPPLDEIKDLKVKRIADRGLAGVALPVFLFFFKLFGKERLTP